MILFYNISLYFTEKFISHVAIHRNGKCTSNHSGGCIKDGAGAASNTNTLYFLF